MSEESLKKPEVTVAALLKGLDEREGIRTPTLIRAPTFEGRRAGETRAFTKKRQKNRVKAKQARAARRR